MAQSFARTCDGLPMHFPSIPLLELRNIGVTLTQQVQSALSTMRLRTSSLPAMFSAVLDISGRRKISGRIELRGGREFDADVRICQVDALPGQAPPARSGNLSGSSLPGVGLLREPVRMHRIGAYRHADGTDGPAGRQAPSDRLCVRRRSPSRR